MLTTRTARPASVPALAEHANDIRFQRMSRSSSTFHYIDIEVIAGLIKSEKKKN